MITTVEEMIAHYVEAWNGNKLEQYRASFAACWADDAAYTDPNFDGITGVDGLANLAFTSLDKAPTRKFSVLTTPDYHHNVGRYTWSVELPGETKEGFDYFEFNEDLKITRLVSFFGALKPVNG